MQRAARRWRKRSSTPSRPPMAGPILSPPGRRAPGGGPGATTGSAAPAGKESTELRPESVSEFFTTEPGAFYSFVFDENGKVQEFTQRQRFDYTRGDRKK